MFVRDGASAKLSRYSATVWRSLIVSDTLQAEPGHALKKGPKYYEFAITNIVQ